MSIINFVAYSLSKGGAAIAAKKFKSLASDSFVVISLSQDDAGYYQFIKRMISFFLVKLQLDDNPIKHSLNVFSYSPVLKEFDATSENIYHFHWINNDTLSVFDLDKIPKGSIFTLHDEWLYCGAEHYYNVSDTFEDFKEGYSFFKKGVYGIHWNYLIWRIKKSKLQHRKDLIYTVPSTWMLERAKSSVILKNSDIRYLPNPIDTDVFKPSCFDRIVNLRARFSFERDDFVFCFGAIGGKKNPLKGANLLKDALKILSESLSIMAIKKVKLIDFGGNETEDVVFGFSSVSVGHIKEPEELALLYSAVDCVVVPSMVESFGQVAAESLSCCTPVLCFDTSGLRDIVQHKKSGLVAEGFTAKSLADCMLMLICMTPDDRATMGKEGREHVVSMFSYSVVNRQYLKILQDAQSIKKK
jgi:glycosyltransferase involved in cell wall biosynthesis